MHQALNISACCSLCWCWWWEVDLHPRLFPGLWPGTDFDHGLAKWQQCLPVAPSVLHSSCLYILKLFFFGWNKSCCSFCVLNAKCTQVSTLLCFEIRRFAGSFFCLFHVIILLQLRQLRLRMKTPTHCFLLVLAWQDYLGRCTKRYIP